MLVFVLMIQLGKEGYWKLMILGAMFFESHLPAGILNSPAHYIIYLKKSLTSLFTCFKLFVFKTKCLLNFQQLFSSYMSRCFLPS